MRLSEVMLLERAKSAHRHLELDSKPHSDGYIVTHPPFSPGTLSLSLPPISARASHNKNLAEDSGPCEAVLCSPVYIRKMYINNCILVCVCVCVCVCVFSPAYIHNICTNYDHIMIHDYEHIMNYGHILRTHTWEHTCGIW